jgi:hypothetical protein
MSDWRLFKKVLALWNQLHAMRTVEHTRFSSVRLLLKECLALKDVSDKHHERG